MPSAVDPILMKKRKSADDAQGQLDHRKRRRNRTTQSCLNCHGSKRMKATFLQPMRKAWHQWHLKNRIAELEEFIREYKKKLNPRWAADDKNMKKGPLSSASFLVRSDSVGSDSESSTGSKDSPSSDSLSIATSPSALNGTPLTPQEYNDEPVFLTSQGSVSPLLFSGTDSVPSQSSDTSPAFDSSASTCAREAVDDIFCLDDIGFPGDDDDMFERVFSQILQQDARRRADAEHSCQCMKKSPAYSVLLELAPHVRRALDRLSALPDHHPPQFGDPCGYLKKLRELNTAISVVIVSVSTSLSSSMPTSALQNHKLPSSLSSSTPTNSASDSPLTRVLAAREAALAQSTLPVPHAHSAGTAIGTQKQVRGDASRLWGGKERMSSLTLAENAPELNQFMTWDPALRLDWP